jgi:hypothetical protein
MSKNEKPPPTFFRTFFKDLIFFVKLCPAIFTNEANEKSPKNRQNK